MAFPGIQHGPVRTALNFLDLLQLNKLLKLRTLTQSRDGSARNMAYRAKGQMKKILRRVESVEEYER